MSETLIQKEQIRLDLDNGAVEEKYKAAFAEAKARLKEEITTDPMRRGYKGKQPAQVAELVNKEVGSFGEPDYQRSRIPDIWAGIPYAKNAVSAEDIKEALKK